MTHYDNHQVQFVFGWVTLLKIGAVKSIRVGVESLKRGGVSIGIPMNTRSLQDEDAFTNDKVDLFSLLLQDYRLWQTIPPKITSILKY